MAKKKIHESEPHTNSKHRYSVPINVVETTLKDLLFKSKRETLTENQLDLLRSPKSSGGKDDVCIYYAGDIELLNRPCVSIVGTREASEAGWLRSARLAKELAKAGAVTVSGLAKGIDTAALTSALENSGKVVAVIGTPLDKSYPAENSSLQERIWKNELLLSPFAIGETTFKSNFPKRNRVMAAITDATVIVEASDTSGTLHQAAECQRLGRWLFIMKSVVDNQNVTWPSKFIGKPKTAILETMDDLFKVLRL